MNIKRFTTIIIYTVMTLIIVAFGLLDYVLIRPHFGINNDNSWINITITVVVVIVLMILTRYLREQKNIERSDEIKKYQKLLRLHSKAIMNNNLNSRLDDYIAQMNRDIKIKTYKERLRQKIYKCKNEQKKKLLIERLNLPDDEIVKFRIKYDKITSSKLYSNIFTNVNENPYDINLHKTTSMISMLICKTLPLIIGAVFTGSIIVDFIQVGASVIYSTIMKIIIVISSVISAIISADWFVAGEVTNTLRKRANISLSFANSSDDIRTIISNEPDDNK